jgi:colicin import membrane protein
MTETDSASSYILPFTLAVAFHVLVGFGVNYQFTRNEVSLTVPARPMYLSANLVTENPIKAKQREQQKVREQKRLERKRASEAEARRRQALEAAALKEKKLKEKKSEEQRRQQELAKKQQEKPREVTAPEPDTAKLQVENERKLMEQRLAEAISSEQNFQIAITDDEKAQAYVSQIQRDIIHNWSRPPSARNGMQALLKVYLVPTGEVVNVVVVQSSGNDAFDRSAVQAVRKAQQFEVPPDAREFERNFREFSVLFKPEDLRL